MLTISKPLSAGQAQAYHREEFSNAQDNYYSEGNRVMGEWHGKLAAQWDLKGEVTEEHFGRLANGQHPWTGDQLVQHRAAMEYVDDRGEKIKTMEHRAVASRYEQRRRPTVRGWSELNSGFAHNKDGSNRGSKNLNRDGAST